MGAFTKAQAEKMLKRKYGQGALNTYDITTMLLSQVKKTFDLGGERFEDYVPLSMGGGRGTTANGTVPEANKWKFDKAYFDSTENLSAVRLSRTLMYASKGEADAWVNAQSESIKRGVLLFRNNTERQLMGNGDGKLGTIEAGTTPTTSDGITYTVDLDPATFCDGCFEEGDYVNIGTGSSDRFEVIELLPDEDNEYANPTLIVERKTGTKVPAASDAIFMQGSENNDIQGLRGILTTTVGSIYGIPVQRRWKSVYFASYGKGISVDLLDRLALSVHRKCGEAPTHIVLPYTQWRLLKSTLEHLKRYNVDTMVPRFNMPTMQKDLINQAKAGRLGFKVMVYDSPFGSMPILISRFCRRNEMFMVNMNHVELKHMKGFGWHDEDGTVWMRENGKTNYEARYGGDMEAWIPPPYHGYVDGLTVG